MASNKLELVKLSASLKSSNICITKIKSQLSLIVYPSCTPTSRTHLYKSLTIQWTLTCTFHDSHSLRNLSVKSNEPIHVRELKQDPFLKSIWLTSTHFTKNVRTYSSFPPNVKQIFIFQPNIREPKQAPSLQSISQPILYSLIMPNKSYKHNLC